MLIPQEEPARSQYFEAVEAEWAKQDNEQTKQTKQAGVKRKHRKQP